LTISRRIWACVLQEKSKAFAAFKSFKAHPKNEMKEIIKAVSVDHCGEYCSIAFIELYVAHGIRGELIDVYQRGKTEPF